MAIKMQTSEDLSEVKVKDIRFPQVEVAQLSKQTKIITHRVSSDAEKFEQGEFVFAEQLEQNYCFEIVNKKVISKIEDSPYYKYLTPGQVAYLKKFDKIAVLTLQKTKYERPYKMSYIKENYPEKIYEKLKKDKVHAWRARTGIELTHLEPDHAEQSRTWKNWNLMTKIMKEASDAKCVEWFGVPNKAYYEIVSKEKIDNGDGDFKSIVSTYKSKFGFDLSYMKLVISETPRHTDGKVVTDPNPIVKKGFAGCHTEEKRIYLNPKLDRVMKSYGLKDVSVKDFKRAILAHELAHEVYAHLADEEFKHKMLKQAKEEEFTTEYMDTVKQNASGAKVDKELFCEYMSHLICGEKK